MRKNITVEKMLGGDKLNKSKLASNMVVVGELLIENKYITKKEYNIIISSYKGLLEQGNCNNLWFKGVKVLLLKKQNI